MSPTPAESFGVVLRRCRKQAGLSQEALALRAGISARAISDLERGIKQSPQRETLRRLQAALSPTESDSADLIAAAMRGSPRARAGSRQGPHAADAEPSAVSRNPLVGRDDETAAIARLLARSAPPLLLFGGEPGIGKSRLLREAEEQARRQGWLVLTGGCLRGSSQQPYVPIVSTLAAYVQTAAPVVLRRIVKECPALWRLLPELVALGVQAPPAWEMPPDQERRLLFSSVQQFLQAIGADSGVVLVLDDLQWAGADAIDLLTALTTAAGNHLRLVGAYRANEAPPNAPVAQMIADLSRDGLVTHHRVPPLAHNAALALLQQVLPDGEQIADGDLIVQQSEGVPFFLVSFADARRQAALAEQPIPLTLTDSLRQRIDALSADARAVLFVVAVAGREVAQQVVLAVLRRRRWKGERVHRALEEALQADLLRATAEEGCQIAHDLIRDVALHDMVASRQAELHGQLAAVLAALPTTAAATLAYHYMRAATPDAAAQAIHYLWEAARHAQALCAFADAERCYQELVQRLDEQGLFADAITAREQLGVVQSLLTHYDQALETLNGIRQICQHLGMIDRLERCLAEIGFVHVRRGTPRIAIELITTYLAQQTTEIGDHENALLSLALAELYEVSGELHLELQVAQKAVICAESLDERALLFRAKGKVGHALMGIEHNQASFAYIRKLIADSETSGDLVVQEHALLDLLLASSFESNWKNDLPYVHKGIAIAQKIQDPITLIFMLYRLTECHFLQGDWQESLKAGKKAAEVSDRIGVSWVSGLPYYGVGYILALQGKEREALRLLTHAQQLMSTKGNIALNTFWASFIFATYHMLFGEPERACQILEKDLADNNNHKIGSYFEIEKTLLAEIYMLRGDVTRAKAAVGYAVTPSHNYSLTTHVESLRVKGHIAILEGDIPQAQLYLDQALHLCHEHGFRYLRAKTQVIYGDIYVQLHKYEKAIDIWMRALRTFRALEERYFSLLAEERLRVHKIPVLQNV